MSDSATPNLPDDEAPTKPTGEREAAAARAASTTPAPPDAPVVWPRDMAAPTPEQLTWGRDSEGNRHE